VLLNHGGLVILSRPVFLEVKTGDIVAVLNCDSCNLKQDWWAGEVLHIANGAREPKASLFQIACIDTGIVRVVNADLVIKIIKSRTAINYLNKK